MALLQRTQTLRRTLSGARWLTTAHCQLMARPQSSVDSELLSEVVRPPRAREVPKLSREDLDKRAKIAKEWSRQCMRENNAHMKRIHQVIRERDAALATLKQLSPHLYQQAFVVDPTPFPLELYHPTETPAIPGFEARSSAEDD
eukprot:m.128436 g.128436  ORF g.128436 m.128436 type:complete len:144 (+) comp13871_c0_seq1:218-649(+)